MFYLPQWFKYCNQQIIKLYYNDAKMYNRYKTAMMCSISHDGLLHAEILKG